MKPSGITFQHTTDGIVMTAEAKYEGLHSVSAVPLWKGCAPGTTAVTFEYGEGILRRFVVDATAFGFIRSMLQRDMDMAVTITDMPLQMNSKSAAYSLFADIVGALFGADKANTMHREFAIWSDNLDKIIDTRVAESAPRSYSDWMKGEIEAGRVKSGKTFTLVDDGQVRNPEVQRSIANSLTKFHTGGPVPDAPPAPPTRFIRDDAAPEFPSMIDRVRKQLHAQAKPDIAPNTMREFLVDFISHSDMVREALQERRHKADESDKLLKMTTAVKWNHEIYTHSEMVIAAHRLLKVIP